MIRALSLAAALLAAAPATAFETLAVLAAGDPPAGPDADLAELAHQLRAACRDRVGGVQDVPTMRARLLGQRSNATVTELDRAYGGALAVYQNGEFESAIRTLKAIVDDLESLPETDESYAQWTRAQLRLAHAALTIGREREADEAMYAVARTDLSTQPDADQYSPTYRRRFEGVKAKVRAMPSRRLQIAVEGPGGTVYVNGRPMGSAPLTLWLPAGTYRIGGAAGALHVPSFRVDLQAEDRAVVLDFALADALRVGGGPGLALPAARRSEGIVRAGAWLGADRVIAVSRVLEGDALFLLGSIYDVRNGALLREGSVRTVAGTVPAANLGALASFLLTGQSSRDVKDRTEHARAAPIAAAALPAAGATVAAGATDGGAAAALATPGTAARTAPAVAASAAKAPAAPAVAERSTSKAPAAAPSLAAVPRSFAPPAVEPSALTATAGPPRWMRPAAYGCAVLAGLFGAVAVQQGLTARQASSDASAMVGPGGALAPGSDPSRYDGLQSNADAATRNAYVSAGAAVAFAVTAGVLGWKSRAPVGGARARPAVLAAPPDAPGSAGRAAAGSARCAGWTGTRRPSPSAGPTATPTATCGTPPTPSTPSTSGSRSSTSTASASTSSSRRASGRCCSGRRSTTCASSR